MVQHELPKHLSLLIGYVGALGRHLSRTYNADQEYPIAVVSPGTGNCTAIWSVTCLEFRNGLTPAPKAALINPNFGNSVSGIVFDANSVYNSLQTTLERRTASGLTLRLNYTYSSCIADASDDENGAEQNVSAALMYTRVRTSSRGYCSFNATDSANFNFNYLIPLGQSFHGVAKALVTGWQLSSLTSVSSGVPLGVGLGFNNSGAAFSGGGTDRPNLVAGCTPQNATNPGNPNDYIKASCFSIPPKGYFGNLVTGFLRSPTLWTTDVSLKKEFTMKREGMGLELRADMFNMFNRVNFAGPANSSVYTSSGTLNGTFGLITRTIGTSRQIQIGARFQF